VILAIVGPTATGKSAIGLEIAEAIGAEICCADSMTVYRGMDVGTAKPTAADRARIPHHLLDLAEPAERFTVARFQAAAAGAFAAIAARGAHAMLIGGSGLYVRAALDGLAFPPDDADVRARLEALDPGTLQARLRAEDPEAARFIDPANLRRVVRALEVIEITGQPFSSFRDAWERFAPVPVAGIDVPDDILDARIASRLRAQLAGGLAEEVRALLADGFADTPTASRAVPYPEAVAFVRGDLDEEAFLEEAVRSTRRLVRRQRAWFRRDPRVRWFDGTDIAHATGEVRAYLEQHVDGGNACAS
jgi:tRNA dimethylallyltransferase